MFIYIYFVFDAAEIKTEITKTTNSSQINTTWLNVFIPQIFSILNSSVW